MIAEMPEDDSTRKSSAIGSFPVWTVLTFVTGVVLSLGLGAMIVEDNAKYRPEDPLPIAAVVVAENRISAHQVSETLDSLFPTISQQQLASTSLGDLRQWLSEEYFRGMDLEQHNPLIQEALTRARDSAIEATQPPSPTLAVATTTEPELQQLTQEQVKVAMDALLLSLSQEQVASIKMKDIRLKLSQEYLDGADVRPFSATIKQSLAAIRCQYTQTC